MAGSEEENQRTKTTRLVRSIAREIAYEVIEEHLEDYEHKPRKPDRTELSFHLQKMVCLGLRALVS